MQWSLTDKNTNNDLQNDTETKDWATRTPLKIGDEPNVPRKGGQLLLAPLVAPAVLLLLQTPWLVIDNEKTGL